MSSLAPKKELTMPGKFKKITKWKIQLQYVVFSFYLIEESSGGQVLVHHQKDRPKPLRNHKNRMTMAPQSSDTKDLSFDKFFPM